MIQLPDETTVLDASKEQADVVSESKHAGDTPTNGQSTKRASFFTRHQTLINFWLDAALLVNFLALIWLGVVVQFVFPPASAATGYLLWGMSLSQWMDVQFATLAVFFFGILVHLMLHWSWVCGVVSCRLIKDRSGKKWAMDDGQRTIFGVGLMIVLLNLMGLGIAWAMLSVQSPV